MLATFALALPLVAIPATTASAATWGIDKQLETEGPFAPGDVVTYTIALSCSDPVEPCLDAVATDVLPEGLNLLSATIASGPPGGDVVADTDADTVTATWASFANGSQANITVVAEIDPDLLYSANGVPITNTASVVAENAEEVSDSADLVPVVELNLDSDVTKTIEPDGALASPGTATTITLDATNTSNDVVDTLVVQDPADPTAEPNPFEYLEYAGTGTVTYPPDADTLVTEYWDGDSWEPLDDAVDPAAVQGVRYTFSGDIQPGVTASIPVQVVQNDAVEELSEPTTVVNDASAVVTYPDVDPPEPSTGEATYVITPPNNSVAVTKSYSPNPVSAGQPTTVTIGAENTGTPVGSLTFVEPSPGTPSPFEGDDALTFTGFGASGDGSGVTWPADATAATVEFTCANGLTPASSTTAVGTLPNPPFFCDVVGFEVEFTGDIVSGGEASIPFAVETDPDQGEPDVSHPNEMTVEVPNFTGTASDTLVTLNDRLATETDKILTPQEIPAVPGQDVIVQLPSRLLPFGSDGSTTDADQVVISDPTDPANPGPFWDHFTATSVRTTDVPPGSTLTINYWDGSAWVPAPGCGPYTGPTTASCDLPSGAQGVQFVFDATGEGFEPGTQFQPNFVAEFTGPEDLEDPVQNCGASIASADAIDPTVPAQGCASIDPFPVDTDGGGDGDGAALLGKSFLGDDPVSVQARSDAEVTAQLTWSTGGFSGVDTMTVADVADPDTTDVADSFFDAFDLVRVEPIDSATDPLIQYDQVDGVELFVAGAWVPATDDPCPCVGSFPGYTLTADESEQATAVRLTYSENPGRTSSDLLAPQPGDGVARSTLSDDRHLDLTFQVRDTRRSDGAAALGSTQGTIYNVPDQPGTVNDTAGAVAVFDGEEYVNVDDDDVIIIDQPLNVAVEKTWDDGPISVPPAESPANVYPTTITTIEGTNTSNAKVDQLRLVEPGVPGSDDVQVAADTSPFDAFTLTAVAVEPPPGMAPDATTTVTLHDVGGTTRTLDEAGAEALTAADLVDVVGVEVSFDGLVPAGASGSMSLSLQLRATDRYDGDPVSVGVYSPVPNGAVATIDDPGGTSGDVRRAYDEAEMVLDNPSMEMIVDKSFSPEQIVEPSTGPVTMTLTGTPEGPSRANQLILTDADPQFWNQYDVVSLAGAVLTEPIDQVQVDVFVGGTFTGEPGSADPVTVTGGSWVEGAPSAGFALPAGVAPADVQGLRFTFTRADGAIWENPARPVQEVPITVERRAELRSGGPVLPDLATNPPAPGETAPGVAGNTVQGSASGVEEVTDPDTGEVGPVTGTAEDEASLLYAHASNEVEIVKDFSGVPTGGTETPASVFPMNITVTNTGDRAVQDLVVSDPMPVDDDGAQLTLAEVDEPYAFELTGTDPDPTEGTPLPVTVGGPDGVAIARTGNLESLEFSFPEGSALGIGQSYTITVLVTFRLGLSSQVVVENTAAVTGDRPWDVCSARLDDATGACEADADVRSTESAVISQSKVVRATDDDELGIALAPGADPDTVCEPDDAGFYSYPCTPVIAPGHDATWWITFSNVGNDPITKLVTYDRIPAEGDRGSYSDTPRGSQFQVLLSPEHLPQLADGPVGTTAAFSYTTTDDYCMDDIESPIDEPVCPIGDPSTGWVPVADRDAVQGGAITAVKAVITFLESDPLEPGESIVVEATTTNPATAPLSGDLSMAFNSAAASAVYEREDGSSRSLLPVEGSQVGVAAATGSLQVTKLVTGDGAAFAPDTIDLSVLCTSAAGSWVEADLDPIPITVTPGEPYTVTNLPYGAECTISEEPSNGQDGVVVTPSSVTIGQEPELAQVGVTNVYRLASLELAKTVQSDAVDANDDPIAFGPFEATVDCTFLDDPVFATGYGPDTPMTVTLEDGADPIAFTGLPAGAECTVTETGTAGAPTTSVAVTQGGDEPVTTDGVSATFVLEPDDSATGETQNSAVITNSYGVGSLEVAKTVDGEGAEFGNGPFTLDVECTLDTGQGDVVVFADTFTLTGGESVTVEDVAAGASCVVTESVDGGATTVDVTPSPAIVEADTTVTVTVTNTFDLGAIEVSKVVDGAAGQFGIGPFEVGVECTFEGDAVTVVPASQTFTGGETVTFDGLPVGAECTVTESDTAGATSSSLAVDDGAPVGGTTVDVVVPPGEDGGGTVEVEATNTFDAGTVVVSKAVDGAGAQYAQGPYEVTLSCSFEGADIAVPGGAARELAVDGSVTYDGLPIGAACSVAETDQNEATSTAVEPASVVVGGEDGTESSVAFTVTNTYDVGAFTVSKVVTGDGAEFGVGPFEVNVGCTFEGADVAVPGGATRTVDGGASVTYDGLPVGADCLVTETEDYGATDVQISTTVDSGDPGEVIVPPADGEQAEITVTNSYDVAAVVVSKAVDGDGAQYAQGPYEVTLDCTFEGAGIEVPDGAARTVEDGGSVTYSGLPVGAACDVSESDPYQATSVDVEPSSVVVGGDDGSAAEIDVLVTNTYDLGEFSVTKRVTGEAAEYGVGPFEVSAECTFEGAPIEPLPGGATRTIERDGTVVYEDLPVGADCVVTETDSYGATDVAISTTVSGGEPGEVVVPPADGPDAEVTVTNTFELGSLQVTKRLAGLGSLYGPGPFSVELACTFQGEPVAVPGRDERLILPAETITYDDLPVGSVCTVTETNDFGATSIEMDPVGTGDAATSGEVVVGTDDVDPVRVTVTNTFETAPLVVEKVVDGEAAQFAPPMPEIPPFLPLPDEVPTPEEFEELVQLWFEYLEQVPFDEFPYAVTLSCVDNQGDPVEFIPGGSVRRFGPGYRANYFGLQDGNECVIVETENGGATSTTIEPEPVVIDAREPYESLAQVATVTNTYDVGSFSVTKAVDGEGAQYGTGPFEVSAACVFEGNEIDVPGGPTRELAVDAPAVYEGLPVDAECVVTESDDGGATSTTITSAVEDGEPGEVVVPASDAEQVSLLVTNTFDLGELSAEKVVEGAGAGLWGAGPFEVVLGCTFDDDLIEIPGGASRTVEPGVAATWTDLPVGADCVVTETDDGGATSSTVSTAVADGGPGRAVVPASDADPVVLTVTNTFDVGGVAVSKEVTGPGAAVLGDGPFEVSLACTYRGDDVEVPAGAVREVRGGQTVLFEDLPVGSECVVTETDDGGADGTAVSSVAGGEPGAVTVGGGDPAEVTVTNMFAAPPATDPSRLPRTGGDVLALLGVVVLLLLTGGVLLAVRRRRP
ncbi:DUF5979 domain-containing protein [Isoptericola aurantiacus]|uniref:DUF5979 domain-containing protein n=1 Tax=Isoptericola aurantiacus TaxID=3377839 RepID=UPI00383B404D